MNSEDIIKAVTRELVMDVTGCDLAAFEESCHRKPDEGQDCLDVFILDFLQEGYCKSEPPRTESDLVESILSYSMYWF